MPVPGNSLGRGDVQRAMAFPSVGYGHRRPVNKGEFQMNITTKLFLASIFALSIAAPVQAQTQNKATTTHPARQHRNRRPLDKSKEYSRATTTPPARRRRNTRAPEGSKKYSRATTTSRIASRANGWWCRHAWRLLL